MTEKEAKAALRAAKREYECVAAETKAITDNLQVQIRALEERVQAETIKAREAARAVDRAQAAVALSRMSPEQVEALIAVAEDRPRSEWGLHKPSLTRRGLIKYYRAFGALPTLLGKAVIRLVREESEE